MTTLADATAAPVEFMGFELHPLKSKDWGKFERWAKEQVLADARETVREQGLAPDERDAFIEKAFQFRNRISFVLEEGQQLLQSVEGMIYVIWMSTQKGDVTLSLDEFSETVPAPEPMGLIVEKIVEISNIARGNGQAEPEKKTETPASPSA